MSEMSLVCMVFIVIAGIEFVILLPILGKYFCERYEIREHREWVIDWAEAQIKHLIKEVTNIKEKVEKEKIE